MSSKQLSSVAHFDVQSIVFSDPKESNIPGSYRVTIGTQYPNGTVGPLLFSTDDVYSFGIQENTSLEKPPRTTGYSVSLCLWNQDGPTEYQKQFVDTLERVAEHIKQHMLRPEVKKVTKKYDLVESDLRKFSPLWYKKEDGEIVQGRGPMLYPKLLCDKNLHIFTVVADKAGHDLDPMQLIGQKCTVRACIKIDSVFVGSKISLQVKVLELEIQQQGNQRQRLICRNDPMETHSFEQADVLNPLNVSAARVLDASDDDSDDADVPPPQPTKRPSARGGKRLVK